MSVEGTVPNLITATLYYITDTPASASDDADDYANLTC